MPRPFERAPRRTFWLLILALPFALPAFAADFIVTRYDDPAPNGCLPADCSLREAVIAATADTAYDRVLLSAGTYVLTIVNAGGGSSANGGFNVNGEIEIAGLGAELTRIEGDGVNETILTGSDSDLQLTLRGIGFQHSDLHGVLLLDGSALIEDCAFVENGVGIALGAGIAANLAAESLVLRRSTSTGNGGDGLTLSAAVSILENVTSTGNGLLEIRWSGNGALTHVFSCNHCTIAHEDGSGDEMRVAFGTVTISNSIVSGSCVFGTSGAVDSAGGNVESSGNSCQFDQGSDQAGVSSGALALGPLGGNGGLTPTILPDSTSVAIGAAIDALCAAEDQRGVARGTACESGAVEIVSAHVGAPIFHDGFLQGSPLAWSSAVP